MQHNKKPLTRAARALRRAPALLPVLLCSLAAQAATDAGQLLNEQQRLDKRAPRAAAPNTPALQAPLDETAGQPGLRAQIQRVRITGADGLMDEARLQALVADARGRTLSHAQLQQLAGRVTQALQAGGYPLARAYLPRQDLSDGELEIAVLPGRLQSSTDRVKVLTTDPALAAWLGAIANAALPEGPVRSEQLERGMLLINDVPGVQARASLEKGDEPGSSRLLVRADTERRWNAQLGVDSFGNRYTGEWRASAQAAVYRPFAQSDMLAGSVSHASGSDQASASYALGLNPQGLRAQMAMNWLRYDVGGDASALELAGTASSVSGGLSYPLLRSRERSLWASADIERKAMTDKALGQELRSRRLYRMGATLNGSLIDRTWGIAQHELSVGFAAGQLSLHNAADRQVDALSAQTAGGFSKLSWSASRLQGFEGAPDWSLLLGASGQLSSRNLDSSEKFILGGPVGIRGQAVGEASGDSGWLVNLELRREFAVGDAVRAQALAFVDHGRIALHARPWGGALAAGQDNGYALSGAGVGLNLSGERWTLRSAYARALGSNPGRSAAGLNADGRSSRHHLWVQAALRF